MGTTHQPDQQQGVARPSGLSPTVEGVAERFGDQPVTARQIVEAILSRHEHDYLPNRHEQLGPEWPAVSTTLPIGWWLERIRNFYRRDLFEQLFGRVVILGVGMADPAAGRAMETSGLFHQIGLELQPPLAQALTASGRDALMSLPLAAAFTGISTPQTLKVAPGGQAVALSGDGRSAAGISRPGQAVVWNLRRGLERWSVGLIDTAKTLGVPSLLAQMQAMLNISAPRGLWLNRDGSVLALDMGAGISLHRSGGSPPTFLPYPELTSHAQGSSSPAPAVSWCALSDDAERGLIAFSDGQVRVFSLPLAQKNEPLPANPMAAGSFSGAASDTQISLVESQAVWVGTDGNVHIWDIASASETYVYHHPDARVLSGALYIWQSLVATADDKGEVRVWPLGVVRDPVAVGQHGAPVSVLKFSEDGTLLASASADGGWVTLWRTDGMVEVGRLPHSGPDIRDMAFEAGGNELVTIASDGAARRWKLSAEPPLAPTYLADQVLNENAPDWIDDDVDAFARLIASRHMAPPLSIGVFGDWGSGKTFFMRHLQQRVASLTRQAQESGLQQREIGYYKHVAQVEFNAWHYASADLWASLVDNLFTRLWIRDGDEATTQKRLETLFDDSRHKDEAAVKAAAMEVQLLESERAAAETHAAAVQQRATELSAILQRLRAEEEKAARAFYEELSADAKDALRAAGYQDLGALPGQVVESVRQAQEMARQAKAWTALLRARDRRLRLLLLLAALLVPVTLGIFASLVVPQETIKQLLGAVIAVGGTASAGVLWLQKQSDWLLRFRKVLTETDAKAELELKAKADALESERAAARQQLDAVQAELVEARDREKSAAIRKEQREQEIRSGKPATLLSRLIGDRAESDYYRKHLGLLSLVRRDFEALSDFVDKDRQTLESKDLGAVEEITDDERRINRIVLYIDDLDRCPPDVVVRVLEAIHLLLSFPLFVVVVGVDSRWVSRALALKYPDLLPESRESGAAAASPLDYLEKIFQVPYWVEPLEPVRTRQLLGQLLGRSMPGEVRPPVLSDAPVGRADASTSQSSRSPVATGVAQVAAGLAATTAADLTTRTMELTEIELRAMDDLAPLLVRTPRALKRFLNTYRLFRTRAFYDGFTNDRGPLSDFRVVMFLLAIVTSQPDAAGALFAELLEKRAPGRTMLEAATVAAKTATQLSPVLAWLNQPQGSDLGSAPAEEFDTWAREAIRYSFRPAQRA